MLRKIVLMLAMSAVLAASSQAWADWGDEHPRPDVAQTAAAFLLAGGPGCGHHGGGHHGYFPGGGYGGYGSYQPRHYHYPFTGYQSYYRRYNVGYPVGYGGWGGYPYYNYPRPSCGGYGRGIYIGL